MIIGMLIGFILGIWASILFGRQYMEEAMLMGAEGEERWEKGDEEYRKAVKILEIEREERQNFRNKTKKMWADLAEKLKAESPELAEFVSQQERNI